MRLTSDLFQDDTLIPDTYTCKGQNKSPSLQIADIPAETVSLALILHDPDAPNGDFLHWSVWNIVPTTSTFEEGAVPTGVRQGINGFGSVGYGGPCPPSGTHRYVFDLYALDAVLDVPEGADWQTIENDMRSHVISTARLVGLFSA